MLSKNSRMISRMEPTFEDFAKFSRNLEILNFSFPDKSVWNLVWNRVWNEKVAKFSRNLENVQTNF